MHDLCFMSNLSSSEWAAWVQAVFSVVAIFAAGRIARTQLSHQVKLNVSSERARGERSRTMAITIYLGLMSQLAEFIRSFEFQNEQMRLAAAGRIADTVNVAGSMDLYSLPPEAIGPFLQIRAIAVEADATVQWIKRSHVPSLGMVKQNIGKLQSRAHDVSIVLSAALGDAVGKAELEAMQASGQGASLGV